MNKITLAAAAAFTMFSFGLATPVLANTQTQPVGCTYQGQALSDGTVADFIRQYNATRAQNGYPVAETSGQLAEYVADSMLASPPHRDAIPEPCRNLELLKNAMLQLNNWQPNVPVDQLTGTITLPSQVTYVAPPTVSEPVVQPQPGTVEEAGAETPDPEAELEIVQAEQAAVTAEIASLRQQVRAQAERGRSPNPAVLNRLATLEQQNQTFDERLATLDELVGQKADRAYVDSTFATAGSVYTREEVDEKLGGLSIGLSWWVWAIIGVIGLLAGIAFVRTFLLKGQIDDKADTSAIPDVSKKADKTTVDDLDGKLEQLDKRLTDTEDQVGKKTVNIPADVAIKVAQLSEGDTHDIYVIVDKQPYKVTVRKGADKNLFITDGIKGHVESNAVNGRNLERTLRKAAYDDRLNVPDGN